jgi:hypothetical protein
MFAKNPLLEIELAHLRKNRPHQRRYYLLLGLALLAALAPLFHLFTRLDEVLVQAMAFVILSVYWFIQWLIMKAAVESANHELADEMLGSYSKRQILLAKLLAVLQHYRGFILLISVAALGLSLALMGYLHRIPFHYVQNNSIFDELGLLRYMSFSPEIQFENNVSEYILLPHFLQIGIMSGILLILTLTNSILTASFGFWNKYIRLALGLRFCLVLTMLSIFLGLFCVRYSSFEPNLPSQAWHCIWGNIEDDNYCQNISRQHFMVRIIESLQVSTASYLDGGVSLTSALLQPTGHNFEFYYDESGQQFTQIIPTTIGNTFRPVAFEFRLYGVAIVTVFSQLSLSAFFLWRASRDMGKKKK